MKYSRAIINWVRIPQPFFYHKCEQCSCWFYFFQQLCLLLDYFVDTLVTADGINKTTQ